MKWILIRHGQTQGNREHRYIGCRTDEPLCPEGIAQLQNRHYPPVSRVFVSPMRRCVETANLLYPGVPQTIIGSFRDEVAAYITANYPDTHRSASPEEVVQFYFAAMTGKKDFTCSYDVLQLPFGDARESYGLNLGTTTIINFAHAHDLAMQYWTVNDDADLAYLASVGADALITDYPDRAAAVLQGMG